MNHAFGYACIAITVIAFIGLAVWSGNARSQHEAAIRTACIQAGGSVVVTSSESHCIRGAPFPTIDGATGGRW